MDEDEKKGPGHQNLVQNEVNHQNQNNDINVSNVEKNNLMKYFKFVLNLNFNNYF